MNTSFKTLMVKMAGLHPSDQQWLLNQLNDQQKTQFEKMQGNLILKKAARFKILSDVKIEAEPALPAIAQNLKNQPALFRSIILEEGQFDWKPVFLKQEIPVADVSAIKPATRKILLDLWMQEQEKQTHAPTL